MYGEGDPHYVTYALQEAFRVPGKEWVQRKVKEWLWKSGKVGKEKENDGVERSGRRLPFGNNVFGVEGRGMKVVRVGNRNKKVQATYAGRRVNLKILINSKY